MRKLDGRLTRNWYLMATVTVVSTAGFALAVAPLLVEHLGAIWPWPKTNIVLLGGLVVSVFLLIAHLTSQQRRIEEVRGAVRTLEAESVERERHSHTRLNALFSISSLMASMTCLSDFYEHLMDTCVDMFDAQQASFMLVEDDSDTLAVTAASGHIDLEGVLKTRQKIGTGVAGWVAETRTPVILGPGAPLSKYHGLDVNISDMTASLVVPVMLRSELVGVLSIRSRDTDSRYDENDLQALRVLAENVGTVIRHSQHVEWMTRTIEAAQIAQVAQSVQKVQNEKAVPGKSDETPVG
jgi:transcriptional regulator with GAF, ATPase, and Fis domain